MILVDQWKKVSHSNLVSLREVFTTKAFGDNCKSKIYVFVHVLEIYPKMMFSTNQTAFIISLYRLNVCLISFHSAHICL